VRTTDRAARSPRLDAALDMLDAIWVEWDAACLAPTTGLGDNRAVDEFHRSYYDSRVWLDTRWLGTPAQKCPLDLWVYQEILAELRPSLIVETGTADGGSALYLASVCDLLGHGHVVTIDVEVRDRPGHPRIRYVTGSSTDPTIVEQVRLMAIGASRVLVVLDSDHSRDHVLAELEAYAPFVTPSSYLIVEDTNVNSHPVLPEHGPGPAEAVDAFLALRGDQFEVDRAREKFGLTFNPGGYLRRR
jgi:cephalosporin hydroxylase